MTPDTFIELMLQEEKNNPTLGKYYKFLNSNKSFEFRKNYYLNRLNYLYENLIKNYQPGQKIWDCGCGFGSTCLFLAMNGIPSYGTTLEFYYEIIEKRINTWKKHGDTSLFTYSYENLFDPDSPLQHEQFEWIVVQDALHHLEPIDQALDILQQRLHNNGKILALEENGSNLIQNLILYKRRGNHKIIDIWDEKLNKHITVGNENIRGLKKWETLFNNHSLKIDQSSVKYTRYYLPFYYKLSSHSDIMEKENKIQQKSTIRKEFLFFGLNFMAGKQS